MMSVKLYEVGGHIRDHLMGVVSNDIDYCVEAESYEEMKAWILSTHAKIFVETPDKYTIRALAKKEGVTTAYGAHKANLVRDYVLCRKEGPYSDGRRPDWVKPGTFEDDILRRDFTVNALARAVDSEEIIDIVGGLEDIRHMRLRCVGAAHERFEEDSLRIIRAIRFIVTKGFSPDNEIESILHSGEFASSLSAVSTNRRRDEMLKCMKHHTPAMIRFLGTIHPWYTDAIFESVIREDGETDDLWLMPTIKER